MDKVRRYVKVIIITLLVSIVLLTGCTNIINNTSKPTEIPILPDSSMRILSEEAYIKSLKGEKSVESIDKDTIQSGYIIRPYLADIKSAPAIYPSQKGYEYDVIPSDEKYYEMLAFVSDKKYGDNIDLFEAMLDVNKHRYKSELLHVTDGEFEHYIKTKKIAGLDITATYIYFMFENHIVSVMVFADVSDDYLEYCKMEKIMAKDFDTILARYSDNN